MRHVALKLLELRMVELWMLQSSCSSLLSEPRDPMSSGWGHLRCKETFASDNRSAVAAGLRSVDIGHFKETVLDDGLVHGSFIGNAWFQGSVRSRYCVDLKPIKCSRLLKCAELVSLPRPESSQDQLLHLLDHRACLNSAQGLWV